MFTVVGDGQWRAECGNAPVTVADKSHKGGDKDGPRVWCRCRSVMRAKVLGVLNDRCDQI